jgi:polyisoprenyl-teichoic acid--peptidoglycan teichoic acid transferase
LIGDEPGGRTPDERDEAAPDAGDEAAPDAGTGEPELPPPATFAGRQRTAAGEDEAQGEGGFTDEVDEVQRELGDELEEPEDEFAFSEDGDEESAADVDEGEPESSSEPEEAGDVAEESGDGAEAEAEKASDPDATIETDTLALGDREEAREAAMAGVRERAAKHEAKRQTAAHAVAAGGAVATKPEEAAPEPEPEAEEPEPAAAPPGGAGEPPKPKALWLRFLTASMVIVTSMATATAVSGLVLLTDVAEGLGGIVGVSEQLESVEGGDPQTILVLGSDKRPEEDTGRSDTAILLRVDPDNDAINLLSIPRDLKVNIPRHPPDKFNAAYSYGGPKLTLETVKVLTGLEINHVVNINFTGFADAVNALDCVYIDVDRSYFIPPESGVAEIDIDAGYQRLCGLKALQYVRFRHEDNDLVRAARQQDFLREARQKVEPAKLLVDPDYRFDLLDIFKEHTTSDEQLEDPIQVLELLKTFLAARNAAVHEVHFPAQLGGPDDPYVTASNEAIKSAVAQFLGTGGTPGPAPSGAPEEENQPSQEPKEGGKRKDKQRDEEQQPPEDTGPAMIDATGAIQPYAQKLGGMKTKNGKVILDFPLYYPTQVPANAIVDSTVLEASRSFLIDGPGDDVYRGYKFVLGIPGSAGFPEYFGVSGTDWENPPILENPSETREFNGREYQLHYDGDRLRLVGWKTNKASYWVNNTLLQTLEEGEMLAIAQSLREFDG